MTGASFGDAARFVLDPRGRMGRKALFFGSFVPFVVIIGIADAANSVGVMVAAWALVAWPLFFAHPWRRLQDMGRRGTWNLVFYGFYALGFSFFFGEYVPSEGGWGALFDGRPAVTTDDTLTASGLGGFSTVLIFLPIQLVWLYLIPGRKADNRFGPARR